MKTPVKFATIKQEIVGYTDEIKNLNYAATHNLPVLLIGETGVGKTAMIRHLAGKYEKPFRRINLNGQTTVDEFVGKTLLNKEGTYWQDGILTEAMRNGYWLVLDELNAALPEILFTLHSLMDDDRYIVLSENNGEIVRPHPGFRLFATMNPSGKYAGTKELNKALLSRFPMILQLKYPDAKTEKDIIQLYSKADSSVINNLIRMANDLRASYTKEEIEMVCSTRDLINTALLSEGLGIQKAAVMGITNRANEEDQMAVKKIVELYFGKEPSPIDPDAKTKEFGQAGVLLVNELEKENKNIESFWQETKNIVDICGSVSSHGTPVVGPGFFRSTFPGMPVRSTHPSPSMPLRPSASEQLEEKVEILNHTYYPMLEKSIQKIDSLIRDWRKNSDDVINVAKNMEEMREAHKKADLEHAKKMAKILKSADPIKLKEDLKEMIKTLDD